MAASSKRFAYEFGRRWDVRVPRYAAAHIVNAQHVDTPDAEIEKLIRARIAASPNATLYTPALVRQTVRYALLVHARGRALYQYVMRGV